MLLGDTTLDFDLNFLNVDYKKIPSDKLINYHEIIVFAETTTNNLHLIIALHRGQLYLRARQLNNGKIPIKELYKDWFDVSYPTANRYENFAILIQSFPKLIVCGLTFDQLVKHHTRLLKFLKSDLLLVDKLRSPLTLKVLGKHFNLEPYDGVGAEDLPEFKFNTGADWRFERIFWYEPEEMEEQETEEAEEEQETEMEQDLKLVHTVCLKLSS